MKDNLTETQIEDEIETAELELVEPDGRASRLWERIKVPASLWTQSQYPFDSSFWVIAILGGHCMYFNFVEGGWGWGGMSSGVELSPIIGSKMRFNMSYFNYSLRSTTKMANKKSWSTNRS